MTLERAIRLAKKWSEGGVCTLSEGEAEEYHKLCLEALTRQKNSSVEGVCGSCVYNPPSSGDGKPCSYCVAVTKRY